MGEGTVISREEKRNGSRGRKMAQEQEGKREQEQKEGTREVKMERSSRGKMEQEEEREER